MKADHYDSFAASYSADNETNLFNAYYERPAILALAGDVAGRRILDAGCGSGPLFAALRDRGAIVTGFDSSTGMLEQARQRLGDGADLRVAELGRPLPYPNGAFDDVVASLVLHYLEDWTAPLAELRRVLKPGGRLIVSVDHPFAIVGLQREAGHGRLFRHLHWTEEWTMGGQTVPMTLLEPAAARDDRRVHRRRLPDLRHQRTAFVAGDPARAVAPCSRRSRASCASCSSSWKRTESTAQLRDQGQRRAPSRTAVTSVRSRLSVEGRRRRGARSAPTVTAATATMIAAHRSAACSPSTNACRASPATCAPSWEAAARDSRARATATEGNPVSVSRSR